MLTASSLRGLYAIIPTPAKEGAEHPEATETVDLAETERVVEQLIQDGVHGLIALGTTGECATLTNGEYDGFVECFLSTVRKRIPTFVGTTALGTHEVVRRMRLIRDLGADGTLLGLPMWQPCTLDMAEHYYAGMSEMFPEIAIMVYANQRAFRVDYSPEFWSRISKAAPTVMSAKFSRPDKFIECREASEGRVHFLPNEGALLKFWELAPEAVTAAWATAASMGPAPALALVNAILAGDNARAKAVDADLQWAGESTDDLVNSPAEFASYNIQLEKMRINAAGYCKAGPVRPPYNVMPEKYASGAQEAGRRWAKLCEKYAPEAVSARASGAGTR